MLNNFQDNFRRDDEEVLNEFRQKQVNFDLEERKNEIDNSRSLFIGALAGLAMAGVVGWFVLAPRYQNNNPEDVPVITRPQTVVKMQPSEPGDVELASQERTVYEIIEKKTVTQEENNIVASGEQPNPEVISRLVEETVLNVTEENTPSAEAESLTQTAAPVQDKSVAAPVESAVDANKPVTLPLPPHAFKVAVVPEKKAEATKTETKAPETAPSGTWQVQLMSSPNKAAVEKSWATMVKKHDVLKDLPYEIESADLGAKGTFYRLKAGSFASKNEATALCETLKAAGGSCFTAKK